MGKRQNFSSRTVITPDACMDIDQLGVPKAIALQQTVPVRVNRLNIQALQQRVLLGAGRLDGALKVEGVRSSNGERITVKLAYCSEERRLNLMLENGMVVHRFLNDDDYVVFNRQPTLHKESMMGHRVKVVPGLSFRLPVPDTTPYNADFDGDEMNMFTPQDPESAAEIKHLMGIEQQMIGLKTGRPSIGCVQDTVIGLYLMARPGCFLDKAAFMSLSLNCRHGGDKGPRLPPPAVLKPRKLYTGYQLASLAIPAHVAVGTSKGAAVLEDRTRDLPALVLEGEVLHGALTKKAHGYGRGGARARGLPAVGKPTGDAHGERPAAAGHTLASDAGLLGGHR